jgi:ABC-type Mn2+/Zn2+ transport system permease subunit
MDAQQAHQAGYWFGVVFGALMVGMLCGLLPWFLGRWRGHPGVAAAGMLACVVGGFLFGLIGAVPTAVVFAIVIALLPAPKKRVRARDDWDLAPRTPRAPYEV